MDSRGRENPLTRNKIPGINGLVEKSTPPSSRLPD
jgi:hypothetical protein